MRKLIIIGAGNVGKFIAYNINNFTKKFEVVGFLDDDIAKQNSLIAGFKVLGGLDLLDDYSANEYAVVFGIAFPKVKKELLGKYKNINFQYPNLISKKAWVSNQVKLGKGCIIYPGVCINYESVIEDFVVINMNCSIGHNTKIESFSSLAPGANLGGGTHLKEGVNLGIGVSTVQNIIVGKYAVIGGQTMLIENAPNETTVVGVPGKIKKSTNKEDFMH